MKSVLISIQPKWCELIASGKKTIEVRKDYPKDDAWNRRVLIYCSKNRISFNRIPKQYQPFMEKLLGKVIGEFVCDRMVEFQIEGAKGVIIKHFFDLADTCLKVEEMRAYAGNKPKLYGWHISDLKIYDKPKELGEFMKGYSNETKGAWATDYSQYPVWLTRPPQSWCYVEEV